MEICKTEITDMLHMLHLCQFISCRLYFSDILFWILILTFQ